MILKFRCVASYLYVPTLTVSDSEIWVGLIGVCGIGSKMLLIRNYCGSWDMNAPGPSKINGEGFLASFLHTTIIFIWSEHSSFSLQCGGSDDLLSLRLWLKVWLLSPVTLGPHVRANIHTWIPRETTVNCTTLTSSLLSQAAHSPHWWTNEAQMPCLHIQGSQSLGPNLISPSPPHPWNWGLVRFYSLLPLIVWCNVMETLVGWFLCPFWVLPLALLTRQYFISANGESHIHVRAQGCRIVFPRGEHGSCTGALREGPFSPCSSSLVTVFSLEVIVKSPSSCLLL